MALEEIVSMCVHVYTYLCVCSCIYLSPPLLPYKPALVKVDLGPGSTLRVRALSRNTQKVGMA